MTNLSDSNPRIYVACLAAYNNGYLHGAWIEADQDADEIRDEIAAMLARSPIEHAEEYAIHDYEGFEGVTISEYAGIDTVARMGAFIAEHGALGAGLLDQCDDDMDQACSTRVSKWRQQLPSTTCSLASTVWQSGHQFTGASFRTASPFSKNLRMIHCVQ